ncbi:hypothetical protein D8B26_001566 [Coccidioides posadasii str. Silveira]|uniref:uncharacterized protein n=1 Tax=Coccidioides posadasii (strain RMSCC 757 / Silveira) TaxID=443226 RepID=UPI001BEF6911|nr:hypothetical protein D8B26_001566 [Coccidioides posadasii str. Silveira]
MPGESSPIRASRDCPQSLGINRGLPPPPGPSSFSLLNITRGTPVLVSSRGSIPHQRPFVIVIRNLVTSSSAVGYIYGLPPPLNPSFFQFPFHLPSTAARNPLSSTTIRMQRRTHLDPRRESYGERRLTDYSIPRAAGWTLN